MSVFLDKRNNLTSHLKQFTPLKTTKLMQKVSMVVSVANRAPFEHIAVIWCRTETILVQSHSHSRCLEMMMMMMMNKMMG